MTPSCVDRTLDEAREVLENVDITQSNLNELNNSVEEHNSNIHSLVNQLQSLNDTVKELQNLTCYIKWIQKVEDIRYYEFLFYKNALHLHWLWGN